MNIRSKFNSFSERSASRFKGLMVGVASYAESIRKRHTGAVRGQIEGDGTPRLFSPDYTTSLLIFLAEMERGSCSALLRFIRLGSFLHKAPLCIRYLSEGLRNFTHPLLIAQKAERGCPALYVLFWLCFCSLTLTLCTDTTRKAVCKEMLYIKFTQCVMPS